MDGGGINAKGNAATAALFRRRGLLGCESTASNCYITLIMPNAARTIAGDPARLYLTVYVLSNHSLQDRGTVDGVAGMITMEWPTYLSLLSVTGVLAPMLEETVFRCAGAAN